MATHLPELAQEGEMSQEEFDFLTENVNRIQKAWQKSKFRKNINAHIQQKRLRRRPKDS